MNPDRRRNRAAAGCHPELQCDADSETKGALPAPRPRNESNLVDALKLVLGKKAMTISEAAKKVAEAGYKTTSPSFRQIVNITFIRSGAFERVDRGRYRVKPAGDPAS